MASSKADYLKKYLSSGADDTKKKKKKRSTNPKASGGITIIDNDVVVGPSASSKIKSLTKKFEVMDPDEEEGPTIAEIIDESIPKGMQDSSKWKAITPKDQEIIRRVKTEGRSRNEQHRRRSSVDSDLSPPRASDSHRKSATPNDDISPPRNSSHRSSRRPHHDDDDMSPLRRRPSRGHISQREIKQEPMTPVVGNRASPDSDISPVRRPTATSQRSGSDLSPERSRRNDRQNSSRNRDRSDSDLSPERPSKSNLPTKTLSGMAAGLQNAESLRKETEKRRRDEESMFRKLDVELSGKNSQTIYRQKGGRKRDMQAEAEEEREKELKKKLHEDKFKKWGKGLIQQQQQEVAINEAIHEISKPLARYKDDKDRDAYLKAIDREGDPMAEYLSKKKEKSSATSEARPKYKGHAPMNRFGILPGYRWDGVDRSNGFEKERYKRLANKTAVADQAYKWSTEEM